MGRLLLVRHGQASFGAEDYDVLSPTGWEQGRRLGAWLAEHDVVPTRVIRGGMRRHAETAAAMAEAAGWTGDPEVDAGWDEFDHLGIVAAHAESSRTDVDSLDRRRFQAFFEEATARWAAGGEAMPETYAGFVARVLAALDRAASSAGSGATVVVISSGGPIAVVAAALTAGELTGPVWSRFNTVVVNSGVTRVLVGSTGARLLTFNEHAHLSGDLLTYR